MAQNTGGEGKGHSKIATTAEEDAKVRRAAKQRRRLNRKNEKQEQLGANGDVLAMARMDRDTHVTRSALGVMRSRKFIDRAYEETIGHLERYGATNRPGTNRPRWSENAAHAATTLLYLYFYGPKTGHVWSAIEAQESTMGNLIVRQVRARFATACLFNRSLEGMPGQDLIWFPEALEEARSFHESRQAKAAKTDDRQSVDA